MLIADEQALGAYIDARFTRTLFRLEVLDHYDVSSESADYTRFLAGEPAPTPERRQAWLDVLRDETARGLTTRRVHVVCPPLSDYLRYECEWGYTYNGQYEQIRILDTSERSRPPAVVDHDFWLIDDLHVIHMHYDAGGRFIGGSDPGPAALDRYRAAGDAAWSAGEPFETWWQRHSEHHRDRRVV